MPYASGDIYYYEHNTTGLSGLINYTIEVYDNANHYTSQTGNFTVTPGETDSGPVATIEWILTKKDIDKSNQIIDQNDNKKPITFIEKDDDDILRIIV